MRKISKKKSLIIGVLTLACVLFFVSLYLRATNPEGRYIEDKISYAGLSYYEFKNGEVFLVLSEGYDRVGGKVAENKLFATYALEDGHWIVKAVNGGETMVLEPGLFSIRLVDPSGHVYEVPRMWTVGSRVIRLHRLK